MAAMWAKAEEAALAYYSGKMVADDIPFIDNAAPLPKELLSSSYPELPSQEGGRKSGWACLVDYVVFVSLSVLKGKRHRFWMFDLE